MFNSHSTDSRPIQSCLGYCVCFCNCGSKGNVIEQAALIYIDVEKVLQSETPVVNSDFSK